MICYAYKKKIQNFILKFEKIVRVTCNDIQILLARLLLYIDTNYFVYLNLYFLIVATDNCGKAFFIFS